MHHRNSITKNILELNTSIHKTLFIHIRIYYKDIIPYKQEKTATVPNHIRTIAVLFILLNL